MNDLGLQALRIDDAPTDGALLRQRTQHALDLTHRDLIAPRCMLVGAVYLVLSVLNYYTFTDDIRTVLSVMALLTAMIFAAMAVYHRFAQYSVGLTNVFIVIEMLILQVDGMAFLVLTNDIMNSYGVFVMIVGVGIFVSRLNWLVINLLLIAATWLVTLAVFEFEISPAREILMLVSATVAAGMFFFFRYRTMEKVTASQMGQELYQARLETALAEIETLSGLLPICASCKNIRDDDGQWQQVETYVRDRTEADFTHSLCPNCVGKYHPQSSG